MAGRHGERFLRVLVTFTRFLCASKALASPLALVGNDKPLGSDSGVCFLDLVKKSAVEEGDFIF